ncbi:MAG: ATP synthase F1 subunit gamma [Bdellovibrionota bacterium]|nr:ATP synthase F1 subunit gamma [Bdellovibrionota bacterium]|tara:strand:+ start:2950 stop:3816 length:867 start_codon:yes stop_codon:yes gene_type:complete
MANIKDLKKKIKSTKGTLKITTAMKLVSAAKMAKAQAAITSSRPYASELEGTIKTISALVQNYSNKLLEPSKGDKTLVLIISANKGLCGGFNAQLGKEIRSFIAKEEGEVKVSFIGKKLRDLFQGEFEEETFYNFDKNEGSYNDLKKIGEDLCKDFLNNKYKKVYVAYNVFQSAISFIPTVKQLLPLELKESERKALQGEFPFDFKYDQPSEEILDSLIPETIETSLYTSYLDSLAAEHGSRMTAMDNASGNCKELIRTTTLKMNKLRQAAITTELIEVISGAESLNG